MSDKEIDPDHYRHLPIEAIDVLEHFNYNVGCSMKYIWRHLHKGNPVVDLKKARWYLDREINRLGSE